MTSSISRLIRWASITRPGKDDKALPIQQVSYLGKSADCTIVFPYGMHANVDGDSLTLVFAVGGDDDNKAGISTSGNRRQQLAPGEVMVYSPVTGDSVVFKAGGGIDLTTTGDLNASVTGDIVASAANTTITSGTVTLDGNVTITGNLTVVGAASVGALSSTGTAGASSFTGNLNITGSLTVTTQITVNGKPVDGHVHGGVTTGGSNTAAF